MLKRNLNMKKEWIIVGKREKRKKISQRLKFVFFGLTRNLVD